MQRQMTETEINLARELHNIGWPWLRIAKQMGFTRNAIVRAVDPETLRKYEARKAAHYRELKRLRRERPLLAPSDKKRPVQNAGHSMTYEQWRHAENIKQDNRAQMAMLNAIEAGLERAHIGVIKDDSPITRARIMYPTRYSYSGSPAGACADMGSP